MSATVTCDNCSSIITKPDRYGTSYQTRSDVRLENVTTSVTITVTLKGKYEGKDLCPKCGILAAAILIGGGSE